MNPVRKLAILTSLTCSAIASFAVLPSATGAVGSEAQVSAPVVIAPAAVHKVRGFKTVKIEEFDATAVASPITPRPKKACTIINGVSGYLGCEVKEGTTTTMYYNCTNNLPP